MADIVKILSDKTGRKFNYVEENIEEAYESRKKWPAEAWQYDAWVSTYTAVAAGEQAGISNYIERVLGRKPISLKDNI